MKNDFFNGDDNSDPKNWKYGIFYFNPNDKRLFPPKRNPYMGWTVNFANPKSILLFVVVLLVIIGLTRLLS